MAEQGVIALVAAVLAPGHVSAWEAFLFRVGCWAGIRVMVATFEEL